MTSGLQGTFQQQMPAIPLAGDHCSEQPESRGATAGKSLVGASRILEDIVEQIAWYATSSAPILITGESGTGKELLARLVHDESDRKARRYARVNCAALSESLVESELFGHEKAAFTGATEDHVGRFEWAGDGSLLLDEISEITPAMQAKLLRVLEEGEFQRVGGNETRPMKARIIATSNRDLEQEVSSANFRADLYYRLNVLHVHVPPLRERREDIVPLARYFIEQFCHEGRGQVRDIAPCALQQLLDYSWPGNVRQLRNVIHRACIMSRGSTILADGISLPLDSQALAHSVDFLELPLREVERRLIRASLERFQGNRTAAANHLGVTPRTLHNRLKQDPDLLRCA